MNKQKGFTLIEILVVVAIVGLLSSVVLVGLGGVRAKGRDAKRLAEIRQVQNALELYYSKCGYYPGGASGNVCNAIDPTDWASTATSLSTTLTTGASLGISKIPDDPLTTQHYGYAVNAARDSYILSANLEDANNPALTSDEDSIPGGFTPTSGFATCADASAPFVYCVRF